MAAHLPALLPPTIDEARAQSTAVTFQRSSSSSSACGMRLGLPIILATCRAHGQDEEPWHILMAWEKTPPTPCQVVPMGGAGRGVE